MKPPTCPRCQQAEQQARDLAAALDLSVREIEGLVGRALELSRGAAMSGAGLAGRLALANYQAAGQRNGATIESLKKEKPGRSRGSSM